MKIRKYITKIVDDGSQEDMRKLADILVQSIEQMQNYNIDMYDDYTMKLYKLAYGCELDEDLATEIVNEMQPYGQRWSMQETEKIQRDYNLNDIKPVDFYVVMNQGFNDFNKIWGDDLSMYIKYTDAFINDIDAKKGKVFKYFTM